MRYALTLLSLLTLLVALAAAGSAGANRHAAKATFKYCTDPTFPPMEYTTTSGKIIGFDVDMATKLAATWMSARRSQDSGFSNLTWLMRAPAWLSVACPFHGPKALESKQSVLAAKARGTEGRSRRPVAAARRRPSARRRVFNTIVHTMRDGLA